MAGEKIIYRLYGSQVIDPNTVRVQIDVQMSSPVDVGMSNPFLGGLPSIEVPIDITESELKSVLDNLAKDWVMAQTAPNVYTIADVRRIA